MIGGKVVDGSVLAAIARRQPRALAWLDTARIVGLVLSVPALALTEARALRPDAEGLLDDLLTHPFVIRAELDPAAAARVDRQLETAGVFDVLAGHVADVADQRGWPALSADPPRLLRVDPGLEVELL